MEIAFVLFSNLDSGNGGVETWLKLFLDEVYKKREVYKLEKIHIYYYSDGVDVDLIGSKYDFICLNPIQVPNESGGLISNFYTYFKFHLSALKDLKSRQHQVKVIVSIGSYPTGIFNWFIFKLLLFRKSIYHVIWLRTTLTKFIKTLNSSVFSKLVFTLERKALKDANLIISNGWDTKKNYISDYNIESVVIPNAIELSKYKNSKGLDKIDEVIRVAFIGRFFENKGVFNFVDSIKQFNAIYPDLAGKINFVFVGWGENSVEQFASETFNCTYVGKISNTKIASFLDEIHCGVALTKFNDIDPGGSGVSNGLLELMVTGKIIIAYDNQIYRQFPNEDFLVYTKENDNDQLASIFADIVNNKNEYFLRSENAKKYVEAFSIEAHVESFFKLIEKV
jgi:glycosyltransferase involved in cell wall biosynthesis